MPFKHHRTVDRIAGILEAVATEPEGLTLTELARVLEAPLSSIQGLVNGLVATGYLDEMEKRYLLGPAPYVLTLKSNRMPARAISHDVVMDLHHRLECSVLVGVRVGTHVIYVDEAGDSPHQAYLSRSRMRRPLLGTVAGQLLLSAMPQEEQDRYLAAHPDREMVIRYLTELPEIRRTGIIVSPISPFSKATVVGCLLRERRGHAVAALSLGDSKRWSARRIATVSAALVELMQQIQNAPSSEYEWISN